MTASTPPSHIVRTQQVGHDSVCGSPNTDERSDIVGDVEGPDLVPRPLATVTRIIGSVPSCLSGVRRHAGLEPDSPDGPAARGA